MGNTISIFANFLERKLSISSEERFVGSDLLQSDPVQARKEAGGPKRLVSLLEDQDFLGKRSVITTSPLAVLSWDFFKSGSSVNSSIRDTD